MIKKINTRVISDSEYWSMFVHFNKTKAKNVIANAFFVTDETKEKLEEIIKWCEDNTSGLIYVEKKYEADLRTFGIPSFLEARFYFENVDDAMLFKLTWVG